MIKHVEKTNCKEMSTGQILYSVSLFAMRKISLEIKAKWEDNPSVYLSIG